MIRRFISYYKPYKKIFILDMIASFLIACLGMLYPITTRVMLNKLIPEKNYKMIYIFGAFLLVIYVTRMFLRFFVQYYGHIMGVKMQAQMRKEMFKRIQTLPYSYYDNHQTGKIMSRMTNDLQDISELAHHAPENFFIFGIMIVGSFIYLLTIEKTLTLIIFACVPAMLLVSATFKNRMRDAFMESRKNVAVINASLESSISGIRVTKAFNNSHIEERKFDVGNNAFVESKRKAYKAMGQFFSSTNFITDFFNVVVLIAGGVFLFQGKINGGDYATFIISINLFITPLTKLIDFTEQYQNGITGFKRFLEIIDEVPEKDRENAKEISNIKGEIEFKNVHFSYNDSKEILKGISFKVPAGKKIALVGPSGEGKTTICHLIPNFYKINSGEITIDGTNINDITLESLRKNIGIVQQDVYLFGGTIKENILYGKPDATDEEVFEASRKANIHDYIMTLEKGYDTEIGERGVKLSGGQKQRLSIARVFLKNPTILILDEATSALDNTTEIFIQKELEELSKGRTTLVVAHRLSTIKNADEIFVIQNGNIKEKGNHNELLETKGIYYKLYSSMFNN